MDMDKEIGQRIAKRRKELGLSQKELGEKIGAHGQTITKIERGEIRFSKFLFSIESSLGLAQGSLTTPAGASFARAHERARYPVLVQSPALPGAASTNAGSIEPPQNNLAVYGTAPRGADLIITNTPIDFTLRPAPLQNVRDAYALLVISDTMSPVFEPGDTLLINPHLPPLRGNDVLLRKDEKDNEPTVIILGHLTGTTERAYTIREYNGPKGKVRERQIDRKDFPNCHRIVGKFSR